MRDCGRFMLYLLGGLLLALPVSAKLAKVPDGYALMTASDRQHRIPTERVESLLLLQKRGARPQQRQVASLIMQNDDKGDRQRIRFSSPANVEGTAMLTVENKTDGDEQWLYLPAFRRTRRVGSAELGDRFVGTDFFYEDLKRRQVEDYRYKVLRSDKLDGQACWVIESYPHKPNVVKESPYGKSEIWLRKDNRFPLRVRLFDKRMRPWKEMRQKDLKKVTANAWRANEISMVDLKRNHRTVLKVVSRKVGIKLSDADFTRHKLTEPF